jgi:hypothetical protein
MNPGVIVLELEAVAIACTASRLQTSEHVLKQGWR